MISRVREDYEDPRLLGEQDRKVLRSWCPYLVVCTGKQKFLLSLISSPKISDEGHGCRIRGEPLNDSYV